MTEPPPRTCTYQNRDKSFCEHPAGESELCFWHDPKQPKDQPEVKEKLEALVNAGHSIEGFRLSWADLQGARLMGKGGLNAQDTDFSHANLQAGHLYHINLQGADLFKCNCTDANLNEAQFAGANLLRCKFFGAGLTHVKWGKNLVQHANFRRARQEKNWDEVNSNYQQLEEIFRHLKQVHEQSGEFMLAGEFFHREMIVRRKKMPLYSAQRFLSKMVDLTSGYSERPLRVVVSSVFLTLFCALVYFGIGVEGPEGHIGYLPGQSMSKHLSDLGNCLYFSVVTFTTLGYGDITPRGIAKAVAAFEAFGGAFGMALFVVTFAKRMSK